MTTPLAPCPGSAAQLSDGVALKKKAAKGLTFVAAAVALAVEAVVLAAWRRAIGRAESTREAARIAGAELVTGTEAAPPAGWLAVRAAAGGSLWLRELTGAR
ncbi:hypothetical protein [Mycolicibacterium sp.]|uniref:hypothetical protein n=1 Tax=Mycolicibacterium sp. TaxID=2320850 RepID=UPI001A3020A4|nr:hypothetical protein [Mycolicibacterium sp.]MBJ7401208.1 hypothetical protein [Mycolicibacterium sp.]